MSRVLLSCATTFNFGDSSAHPEHSAPSRRAEIKARVTNSSLPLPLIGLLTPIPWGNWVAIVPKPVTLRLGVRLGALVVAALGFRLLRRESPKPPGRSHLDLL